MSLFSGLNINEPKDTELVANLPAHIRATRRSIAIIKVLNVQFEDGVERGDLVFPEKVSGKWLRAHAGIPERNKFFGVAFPEDAAVVVGATVLCPDWNWEMGQTLYLDDTRYGKMTYRNTGVIAGMAITPQLVMFNIFEQELSLLMEEFKKWYAAIKIEITTIYEYIKDFENTFKEWEKELEDLKNEILKEIDDKWGPIEDRLDELEPLLDEALRIYTTIDPFLATISVPLEDGMFKVPYYQKNHCAIFVHVNGVLTWEWEYVGENDVDSQWIKINEPVPLGSQISGLVIGLPRAQKMPIFVAHDDSLKGAGTIPDPLGISDLWKASIEATIRSVNRVLPEPETANVQITRHITYAEYTQGKQDGTLVPGCIYVITDPPATPEWEFVHDVEYQAGADSAVLSLLRYLDKSEVEDRYDVPIPIATGTQSGFMPASAMLAISKLQDEMLALIGGSRFWLFDSTELDDDPAAITQQQLTEKWAELSGHNLVEDPTATPNEGETLEDAVKMVRWVYRNGSWFGPYTSTMPIATNVTFGAVLGSPSVPANYGKVFVEPSGTMTLLGYDQLASRVTNIETLIENGGGVPDQGARVWSENISLILPYAGAMIAVPMYTMNVGALVVYVNGLRTTNFTEMSATQIRLNSNIAATDSPSGVAEVVVECYKTW